MRPERFDRTGDCTGIEPGREYDRRMLYGRDAERSRVGRLLEDARESRSGVLILRGEPGVGKSALLEEARAQAADMRVLGSRGVESEARLPFAGLHQLLRPVLDRADELPDAQAGALRGALGLAASGAGRERFLVSVAVLSLLAEVAEERPLLCLVDDAHWLDEASADALVFVARRLEAERIAMLFAAREGEVRAFDAPSVPELRLSGLDPSAASALLEGQAEVVLSPELRQRLVADTEGNPLALLELSSSLSAAQLSGTEPLLEPLPVSARVERAFVARVHRLPEATQALLLVAAADESGDLATVLAAAACMGADADALDSAERARLVHVHGAEIEFRHPLVRSAVYQAAPLTQRRAAHRALASVLEGVGEADRRAWHRAAASVEPDPDVVEELEQAARRAAQRSAFAAASLAFERAAALTRDEQDRARRLAAAGENAWLAGQVDRSMLLLEGARPLASEPTLRADIDRWRGLIEMTRGVPVDACELLVRAATDVAPHDGGRALQLLNLASLAAAYAGDPAAFSAIAELARGLTLPEAPFVRMLSNLILGLGAHVDGDFESAAPRLRLAIELAEELQDDAAVQDPVLLLFAGRAALYLGDDEVAYRSHHEAALRARAGGVLGVLTQILPRLTHLELSAGRWHSASANAAEGLELGREIGQHDLVAQHQVMLALLAAFRGDEDECRALAAESLEHASARRLGVVSEYALWSLALLELGLGQAGEALRRGRGITGTMVVFWSALDRIEASIRAGEQDLAREWLGTFERWAASDAVAWAQAVVLHCQALLAGEEEEAESLFASALEAHAQAARPFERARTELAFGEFLRRTRRRIEAREHLRAALESFETLGAKLWAERARVELRASGQTARRRDPSTREDLTSQELQIARFVAEGLTNREVAAQLFLSPRTVDFHLRNVFRKLGITARTQLARLDLDSAGEPASALASSAPPVRT
jgi:DNA-binding CsgD family transcriptional regulator